MYLIGNGGSSAVADHIANDLVKRCNVRASSLTNFAVSSTMANDYSWEDVFAKQLEVLAMAGDMLVAISSGGRSPNIIRAVAAFKFAKMGSEAPVVTLSAFDIDNPLRWMGSLNIWCDTKRYGIAETAHQAILHMAADLLAGDGK